MAHDINIILDLTDSLMGNATEGKLADFRAAALTAQDYLNLGDRENDLKGEALHNILHEAQEFLEDGLEMESGAVDTIETFTDGINELF